MKTVETFDTTMGHRCAAASIAADKGTSRFIQVNVVHSYILSVAFKSLNWPLFVLEGVMVVVPIAGLRNCDGFIETTSSSVLARLS